jgi:RimJ/RimL family protein N-acetyltransferase
MSEIVTNQVERVADWVASRVGQVGGWGPAYAMGLEDASGKLTAGIVLNNFNGANATCHIAIDRPSKALFGLLQAFCDYAFRQCRLKRITGMVPSNETRVIEFDKKLGFETEFVMRDGAPGADMHVLVMWADKCRWLKGV